MWLKPNLIVTERDLSLFLLSVCCCVVRPLSLRIWNVQFGNRKIHLGPEAHLKL
jgi:hypothetical protein